MGEARDGKEALRLARRLAPDIVLLDISMPDMTGFEAAKQLRVAQAEKHRIEKMSAAYVQEQLVLAQAEADTFMRRLKQYQQLRRDNPSFLAGIWWDQIGKLFTQMRETGRLDLLDNHLGPDGLDITVAPQLPKRP